MGLKEHVTTIPAHLMAAGDVVSSCHESWHVEVSLPIPVSQTRKVLSSCPTLTQP